jgi:hypothetical protein
MYERMLDKLEEPSITDIEDYIGSNAASSIQILKRNLEENFQITYELKFPFGNTYGWGYKVSIKKKNLLYIFFEKEAMTVTFQIKALSTDYLQNEYRKLSEKGKEYWENRYPCGNGGGWIHYRVLRKEDLKDIGVFIMMKLGKTINWAA